MPYFLGTCGTCRFCRSGRESCCDRPGLISYATSGGYAEAMSCPARQLLRVPGSLGDADAAALQIAFGTAWHALFACAALQPGETVLINSVGSGVGSAALQLAKLAGAHVVGTASADRKLEWAATFGLDAGINYVKDSVVDEVMRLTGDRGADVVFEYVGGPAFQAGLDSLGKDGRMVVVGGHAGEVVPFDIIPFFRAQKSLLASLIYTRAELESCLALAELGRIEPVVHETFPLSEARAATELLERRENFGKIVLVREA